jgi:hypothetical protein
MTPRQLDGWMQLAHRRKTGEHAMLLTLLRVAKSEQRAFQSFLRRLQDESL